MIRTQIQITSEQAEWIRKFAAREHISMSDIIRRGIDTYIQYNKASQFEQSRKRALNAMGRFHSKHKDVATNHDKYLAEAFKQ